MLKKISAFILIIFLCMSYPIMGLAEEVQDYESYENYEDYQNQPEPIYIKGKVISILEDVNEVIPTSGEDMVLRIQTIRVKGITAPYKGELFTAENVIHSDMAYNYVVRERDQVVLYLEQDEAGVVTAAYVAEPVRDRYLTYLSLVFIFLLIVIGRTKGVKAVITLALTIWSIIKILLPGILQGYNPVLLSILISIVITIVTLWVVSGWNRKTLTAIIGTTAGVLIAGIIAWWIGHRASLTGLNTSEAQMLLYIPQGGKFDFKGILFAGIILGALGAVMDVSMSIASSLYEIKSTNPSLTQKDLIRSGMNVGKDVMGTMSNTLILAYTGGAIHVMLLFLAYEYSLLEIMNLDMIATEIVRALSGSIGLLCAIPLTTVVGAFLLQAKEHVSKP
ncbi:MAG: YibE/F family protein [Epulopiscium sp.]|nr:YibE/F family protein [Candidatus Epulonipiscium sp.]